jgi:hypothetical protein
VVRGQDGGGGHLLLARRNKRCVSTVKLHSFKINIFFPRLTESRWHPPPDGYFSIAEQEDVNKKHEAKEARKVEQIYVQQAFHGAAVDSDDEGASADSDEEPPGTVSRAGPYGKWQAVKEK